MNRTVDRILKIIDSERDELINKYNETTTKKGKEELRIAIEAIGMISRKIDSIYRFESSDNFMQILKENDGKNDLKLLFVDGTEFTIPKKRDYLVSIDEYTICIHEKSKDKTIIPPVLRAFNIDNLVEIKRVD